MSETLRLDPAAAEWRVIDGELVGLQTATSTYFALNESGTLLWQRLAGGSTRDQLAGALADAFGLERERARGDVDRFLEVVGSQGLLAPGA